MKLLITHVSLLGLYCGTVTAGLSHLQPESLGVESSLAPIEHHQSPASSPNIIESRTTSGTYSCGPGKPCDNGACCGKSGYCGYGPTYCGSGCTSNCGATAQCGKDAAAPGTKCPLNVCCSKYGFCGTTEQFCTDGCQSNCVLNPKPPAGGAEVSIVKNKVIGYYESWSSTKACHKIEPSDLPLDALTHLNFAFAYIDPDSFDIVAMDSSTPSSLFQATTNVKQVKPDLQVFVSVGGWSFSDSDTKTQPLFGEIASTAENRLTFANNVVRFLNTYGFDGLDIDWEYPGAPDRGGKEEDTANYVSLLETLRTQFSQSGKAFGLTFTAPSSYWYLQYFDLANMVKYADWINFMSYDLNGVWNANDPIGAIVQASTNLTEIKAAAELFWRADIPPRQIVMGFGFYGRAYTLSDAKCGKPGCAFKGASLPGPCTDTPGILGYYEILAILNGPNPPPQIHDEAAAVMYFTYHDDQWVSYDNAATFQQKVDWANSVGMGGAMIWASDLDNAAYDAHSALIGEKILSNTALQQYDQEAMNPQAVLQSISGSNGQGCFAYTGECKNLNDNNAMAQACGSGYTVVGWDDAGCGSSTCHCGKPICCPVAAAPKSCIWRGNNNGGGVESDCSGQCLPGEENIKGIRSSWGGGFLNDGNTDKCGRGYKVFCCPDPQYNLTVAGCYFSPCGSSCARGTVEKFEQYAHCGSYFGPQKYCCPTPSNLVDCQWVRGSSGNDCANAVCNSTQVEVSRSTFGGSSSGGCAWGRQQAACCTILNPPPAPAVCSADLCNYGLCNDSPSVSKRGAGLSSDSILALDERGTDSTYPVTLPNGYPILIIGAIYPAIRELFSIANAIQVQRTSFQMNPGPCAGPDLLTTHIPPGPHPGGLDGFQTEHPIDRQLAARFVETAAAGLLRDAIRVPGLPAIGSDYFMNSWEHIYDELNNEPPVGGPSGAVGVTPMERMMEAFGSTDWPAPLLATSAQINGPKGNLMNMRAPFGLNKVSEAAQNVVQQDTPQVLDVLMFEVRVIFAIFEYMNNPIFEARFAMVNEQVRRQLQIIGSVTGQPRLVDWWDTFIMDWLTHVQAFAQSYADQAITAAAAPLLAAQGRPGASLRQFDPAMNQLETWLQRIPSDLVFRVIGRLAPPRYPPPGPPPGPSSNVEEDFAGAQLNKLALGLQNFTLGAVSD